MILLVALWTAVSGRAGLRSSACRACSRSKAASARAALRSACSGCCSARVRARSSALWKLFSFAQLRSVRSLRPSASAVATWVIPAPHIAAAACRRARRRRRRSAAVAAARARPLAGLRAPIEIDDAPVADRLPDLKRCCPKPVAPLAPLPKALLERRRNRLRGRQIAHRILASQLERNRGADLQVPQPPLGLPSDPNLDQPKRARDDVHVGVHPENSTFRTTCHPAGRSPPRNRLPYRDSQHPGRQPNVAQRQPPATRRRSPLLLRVDAVFSAGG